MKTRSRKPAIVAAAVAALLLVAAGGWGLYRLGASHASHGGAMQAGAGLSADAGDDSIAAGEAATRRHLQSGLKAGDVDPATGRQVLYYHDPMVPGKRFDAPGKSPFMDMMLVPVYAGAAADSGTVSVSPRMQQSLGIRTAPVEQGTLAPQVEAVGTVAWNERDQVLLQARAAGFVEKLHVRAALDRVAAGQPLVELYVPDWVAAQEEFLALRRMQGERLAPLVEAARLRMRQAGMSEAQIRAVEAGGSVRRTVTLTAPRAGVVTELMVREGMSLPAGADLMRINGLSTVWVHAEVPESQAARLRPGARVEARTPLGGPPLAGRVQALLPEVSAGTRTLRARIELPNPGGRLTPGLFVSLNLDSAAAAGATAPLLVPSEAVIQTGRRSVVMVAEGEGRYRPVEVELGAESNGRSEIRKGLQAGQSVVVSGQFLLDSEASLRVGRDPLDADAGRRGVGWGDGCHGRDAVDGSQPGFAGSLGTGTAGRGCHRRGFGGRKRRRRAPQHRPHRIGRCRRRDARAPAHTHDPVGFDDHALPQAQGRAAGRRAARCTGRVLVPHDR